MEKAYKFRIYPNKKQKIQIAKTFGCCRFVYNYYLAKRKNLYETNKETFGYNKCSNDMTILKNELSWLKEADSTALQSSLRDLDTAYKNFFRMPSNGYPKFKSKKYRHHSYKTKNVQGHIKFLDKHIQLPKLGYVKIRDKQIPQGRILNATISQEPDGKYYCSLCCTDVQITPFAKTNNNIGIDLGIVNFANMSNGNKIANPKFFEKSEDKLARLQRELSRKTIGGSNWNKTRIKIARLQKHIVNQRTDFLQKLSTEIVKNYDKICIEDLDVKELLESKLETNKETQIRHKHIVDVSWSEFKRMLQYKCDWYDKELKIIDRYYPSSQICHVCGHNDGKKDVNIRIWKCSSCNSVLDRDINAAINILNAGLN